MCAGKLGISFERNVTPLVIKRIVPNTLAAEKPELLPGMVLQDVGYPAPWAGAPITELPYPDAIQRLRDATRPITFVFAKKGGAGVSGGYGKWANAEQEAGRRPWLVELAESAIATMEEGDKVQANGARALGSLAALLLQPAAVAQHREAAELQPRIVEALLRGASARAPKVAWNSCYALSHLLQVGGAELSQAAGGRIIDTLLQTLLFSPNFKVRLSAAAGLTSPATAAGYCGRLGEALATVCEAATQFETNSFGTRRPLSDDGSALGVAAGGATGFGRGSGFGRGGGRGGGGGGFGGGRESEEPKTPTSPLGRFSRPGLRTVRCPRLCTESHRTLRFAWLQGMVSMSAEEDRANLKHKAALRARLEATTLHLLRVVVTQVDPMPRQPTEGTAASDADDARKARLSRLDGEASGQEPEPEPEPESGPEQGEGLRDSLSTEVAQMLLPYVPLISRLLGQQVCAAARPLRGARSVRLMC